MNVYPKEELAQNEVKRESWGTIQHPDAKKLRDKRARELRKDGWTVTTNKVEFSSLGRTTIYTLEATRPRQPEVKTE